MYIDGRVYFQQASVMRMEKDPLRWHGGIKISMAVALSEGLEGLVQDLPQVIRPKAFFTICP
jgi:hypothetical protein